MTAMKACSDCSWIDDTKRLCTHPRSANRLLDALSGEMRRVLHHIQEMRTIGPCGPKAKLFEGH